MFSQFCFVYANIIKFKSLIDGFVLPPDSVKLIFNHENKNDNIQQKEKRNTSDTSKFRERGDIGMFIIIVH